MSDLESLTHVLKELPMLWRGLHEFAASPPRRPGVAGDSTPGPRAPLSLEYLDAADELHIDVASWSMLVGEVLGSRPPLALTRFVDGRVVGGGDPSALCQWLSSALPEVEHLGTGLSDMTVALARVARRGRAMLGLTEISEATKVRAREYLALHLKGVQDASGI